MLASGDEYRILGDRPVAMEMGSALRSTLPYEKVDDIIQTQINPHFEQGKFDLGLVTGTQAIIQILENESKESISILQIMMLMLATAVFLYLVKVLWGIFR